MKIKIIIASLPLILGMAIPCAGATVEDLEKSFEETRQQLSSNERVRRQVLGTLYSINKKMKVMSKRRGALTDRMFAARSDAQGMARVIAELENRVDSERKQLSQRLRVLYRMNVQSALRLLFSSSTPMELDRNVKYLRLITDRDYQMIKDYEGNLKDLRRQRELLKKQVQRLAKIQKELKGQEGLLAGEQKSKAVLLEKLKSNQDQTMARYKSIKEQDSALFETAFFERKGQLIAPVDAPVTQEYGFIQDPEFRYRLSHKGVFYKVTRGTPVKSVHRGQIVYVGKVRGNGWTIIVDHGDHYHTVYTSTSNVAVKKGDIVTEGQILGASDFSEFHGSPGMYFEIRHFSDAIDPLNWIKDTHSKRVSQADI